MTTNDSHAARLIFTSADPAEPDPAAVGAAARDTVQGLRATGNEVTPAYTGEKGAAEIFLWVLAASTTLQQLMALPEFALKVAQLLNEFKKLRGDQPPATPSTPAPQPIVIVLRVGESTATLRSDTAPSDVALLADLLAEQLPAQIDPANVTVEVQVPPTPLNEI